MNDNNTETETEDWTAAARELGNAEDFREEVGQAGALDPSYDAAADALRPAVDVDQIGDIKTLGDQLGIKPSKEKKTRASMRPHERDAEKRQIAFDAAQQERDLAVKNEIADREATRERIESARLAKQEEERFTEIDPLRRGAFFTALAVGIAIFIGSALFSFAAIAAVAVWMRPEWPWLVFVVPFFIEAFLIYFSIDGVINQAKAHNPRLKPAQQAAYQQLSDSAFRWMIGFAVVAVVGNAAHTTQSWIADGDVPWFAFIGIAMAAIAPLSVVLISKRVSRLVFTYAV